MSSSFDPSRAVPTYMTSHGLLVLDHLTRSAQHIPRGVSFLLTSKAHDLQDPIGWSPMIWLRSCSLFAILGK